MKKRDKLILVRVTVSLAPIIAYAFLVSRLVKLLLGDDPPGVVMIGISMASCLVAIWIGLTVDEHRWAPKRRFAILRHLYLQPEREPVEMEFLMGELETCPTYGFDLEFLSGKDYLQIRDDGEPTGDIHHDGRPVLARRCRLTPAGRTWIERNPVMP
jgi:hypothetical protein